MPGVGVLLESSLRHILRDVHAAIAFLDDGSMSLMIYRLLLDINFLLHLDVLLAFLLANLQFASCSPPTPAGGAFPPT